MNKLLLLLPLSIFLSLISLSLALGQTTGTLFSPAEISRYEARARAVSITEDTWGIPHIYGKTDADVVFGLLYTECREDFSRVEKNYLEMLGRQAEAYGEENLVTDIMMRLIYDSAQAVEDYRTSPPWMHALLDAFADGVNYYLYKHPETKPLLLKRWEPWYALMFTDGSVSATSTGGIRPEEIRDFYGKSGSLSVTGFLRDREDHQTGSNGFALAGFRTASGNPILYINPHVPFYFRMEVQLVSEEGLNAYGAVTWGQFFIYQGFNAHCGWMHTSSYADVADLYAETTSRKDSGWVYEYEGQQRPVLVKPFTVYCKKEDKTNAFPVTGYYTHHGPVMGSRNGKWLSLKEYNRSLNALMEAWQITKAGSFGEYKKAMEFRANTTNNTVYADDQGNIAYWHGNFIPIRDTAFDWSQPVDGSVAATEWKGTHALEEIIHVYNPGTGWIQNCNSTPFSLSGNSSPDKKEYPVYMAPEGENFRAVNAIRLLSGADNFTLDSLIVKGYDRYLAAFDSLLPALQEAYAIAPDSVKKALQEPMQLLKKWDKRSAVHSVATTLAIEWGTRMTAYAPVVKSDEEYTFALKRVAYEITHSTASQKTDALLAVIKDLQERFGDWKIEWGNLNRYQRLTGKIEETYSDKFISLPAGLAAADFGSLPSFQSRVVKGTKKRYGYSGNSFIAAVEFGKKVKAKTIVTGGSSDNPASPHFADQATMYLEGRFKDIFFYPEEVTAHQGKKYHPGGE
ncbi:penicillin acylase family protein [Flavitalea flava]